MCIKLTSYFSVLERLFGGTFRTTCRIRERKHNGSFIELAHILQDFWCEQARSCRGSDQYLKTKKQFEIKDDCFKVFRYFHWNYRWLDFFYNLCQIFHGWSIFGIVLFVAVQIANSSSGSQQAINITHPNFSACILFGIGNNAITLHDDKDILNEF